MKIILVYTTNPDEKTAKNIGDILLKEKLIACYNLFPIKSGYFWQGKKEESNEFVGIFKTTKEKWSKLKKRIKEIHPYKIPCILKFEMEANKEYYQWVKKSVR